MADTTSVVVAELGFLLPPHRCRYPQMVAGVHGRSNATGSDQERYCRYYDVLELDVVRWVEFGRLLLLWEFGIFVWALRVEHLAKTVCRSTLNSLQIQQARRPRLAHEVHS